MPAPTFGAFRPALLQKLDGASLGFFFTCIMAQIWAAPPVRLGLSGRNPHLRVIFISANFPPKRKRGQFFGGSQSYGWKSSVSSAVKPPGFLLQPVVTEWCVENNLQSFPLPRDTQRMLRVHLLSWGCVRPNFKDWATPPVRPGLSGRNSGKIPERPRKRSQSVSWNFPREYGWDAPNPIIQGI